MSHVATFAAPKPMVSKSNTYAVRFAIGSCDSYSVKVYAATIETAHCAASIRVITGRAYHG